MTADGEWQEFRCSVYMSEGTCDGAGCDVCVRANWMSLGTWCQGGRFRLREAREMAVWLAGVSESVSGDWVSGDADSIVARLRVNIRVNECMLSRVRVISSGILVCGSSDSYVYSFCHLYGQCLYKIFIL